MCPMAIRAMIGVLPVERIGGSILTRMVELSARLENGMDLNGARQNQLASKKRNNKILSVSYKVNQNFLTKIG